MHAAYHKKLLKSLLSYEKSRHENNLCDYGNYHKIIEGQDLINLFNNLITYYLNTNKLDEIYQHNDNLKFIN